MLNQYFVTGTDTGVGKTFACAMLVRKLNATYWKPVQSGLADEISDANRIKKLTGLSEDRILKSNYSLQASLSPDQAAKQENITIDLDSIVLPKINTPLIVEGAGGVFVPLNEKHCMMDLMQKLQLPVIIVTRGLLGTINHTLLTIEALRQRNLKIHGIIFSGELNPDNQTIIEKWGKVQTLMHIPLMENANDISFA
jgi:dethiobiotin synthetase